MSPTRHTINQLLGGQLGRDDTQQLLDAATASQDERSRWIIENWPHVVRTTK